MPVLHVCIFTHVLLAACVLCGWHSIAGKYVGACLPPLRVLQVVGRVGVEEEMLEAGELRHPFPLACVVHSKPLLAGSQAASCRARGTSSLHLLEVYD